MNEQENESFADWLFFARKQRHRRRITHGTLSTTQNTDQENE